MDHLLYVSLHTYLTMSIISGNLSLLYCRLGFAYTQRSMIKWKKICWFWVWHKRSRKIGCNTYLKCTCYHARYIYSGYENRDVMGKIFSEKPCMGMRLIGQKFYTLLCLVALRDKRDVTFYEKAKCGFIVSQFSFLCLKGHLFRCRPL